MGLNRSRYNMNRLLRWSLSTVSLLMILISEVTGEAAVGVNSATDTDVPEDNLIIVMGNISEYEKLSEVSKLLVKQTQVVRTGRSMLSINLENSRGEKISTMSFSPTSLIMSMITLLLYVFYGEGDLTSKGLIIAQILNG